MTKSTAREEWYEATSRLKLAKRAAGIDGTMAQLAEDYDDGGELYQLEQRRIVLAIPDLALRKDVIRAIRDCHRLFEKSSEEELRELQARVRDNGERIRRNNLWGAIFFGLCAVSVGHWVWGVTGAIGGAVVAVLVGIDHIRRADRLAKSDVDEARSGVKDQTELLRAMGGADDSGFSAAEEQTGQPDPAS